MLQLSSKPALICFGNDQNLTSGLISIAITRQNVFLVCKLNYIFKLLIKQIIFRYFLLEY